MSKTQTPVAPKTASKVHGDVPTVETPAGVGIKIDNVNKTLWQYIKRRKLFEVLLFVPLVIIWEVLAIILLVKETQSNSSTPNVNSGKAFGYIIALPFFLFFAWVARIRKKFEAAFLEEFALANQYSFIQNGTVDETYGTIFRLTGHQQVSDVVTGTYNGSDLRLFLYELKVGSGQYQRQYQDTVIELDLHGRLPNLLIINKQSNYGQLDISKEFGIKNTLQLEGDFNQYFTLYAPQGNEIEALEIFSPDTMALMEDASKHYSVEFAGNRIYVYSSGFITTTEELTQAFALAKKLIDKIAPLASTFQKDSAIITTPVNILDKRKHSIVANKLALASIVILTLAGLAFVIFAIINSHNQSTPTLAASSPAVTKPQAPTLDATAFPYCGNVPNASMPVYTQQFINLIIAQNKLSNTISAEIKAANYTASNAVINQVVADDQQYVTSLKAINFPTTIQPDLTNVINALQNYDTLITQEETSTVSSSALTSARNAVADTASTLHTALGLTPSTCGFYGP